jgi:hypothetical protein
MVAPDLKCTQPIPFLPKISMNFLTKSQAKSLLIHIIYPENLRAMTCSQSQLQVFLEYRQ